MFLQMSRFLDMKVFGDAAHYLRLTNLEHLAAKAQAFDGTQLLSSIESANISGSIFSSKYRLTIPGKLLLMCQVAAVDDQRSLSVVTHMFSTI